MTSPVWAITSYYPFDDPVGEKRRLRLYHEFRRRLQIPLVTVELARCENFDLDDGDAEILVRRRGGDVLWQKERLLNIALEALPKECDTVAWIDCDVVLERDDWHEAARRRLEECRLVQPFRRVHHLSGHGLDRVPVCTQDSIAFRRLEHTLPPESFRSPGCSQRFGYAPGLAWAARKETLLRHGLYDALIVGSGDKLMFSSACGRLADCIAAFHMNPRQREHYERWATPFFETVQGRVGYVDGDIFHLWHGDLGDRHYADRYDGFDQLHFDPWTDIALSPDGVWRWSSDKPALHALACDYFDRRRSGGSSAAD